VSPSIVMTQLNFFKKSPDLSLLQLLERTIQVHGPRVWQQISLEEIKKGEPDSEIIPQFREFLDRMLTDWLRFKSQNPRQMLPFIKQLLPLSAGFSFSWLLPISDICFRNRLNSNQIIYLHRPMILLARILVLWLQQMFRLAQEHSGIGKKDHERMLQINRILEQFEQGFRSGVYRKDLTVKFLRAARLLKKHPEITFPMDPSLMHWLETQIKFR